MSKDPIIGIDSRIVDQSLELFRFYEDATLKCFTMKGSKLPIDQINSLKEMKEMEAKLRDILSECRQSIWSQMKQSVGSQVQQVEECYLPCVQNRTFLMPAFVKSPDCRRRCYAEHATFFQEYIKNAQFKLPQ